MLTKRTAALAIFGAALAKMAHADEPPKAVLFTANAPLQIEGGDRPMGWTINLDHMAFLDVYLGDQKVRLEPADLFAALKAPTL